MVDLCNCLFPSVAPEQVVPVKVLQSKKKDERTTKVRASVIATLDKEGKLKEKNGDLDDLIKDVNDDDVDVDELIRKNQVSMEALDSMIESSRTLIEKNTKIIKRCEHFRWGSPNEFMFQRMEINLVDVESADDFDGKSLISFKTTPRRKTKSFGVPASIPSDLTEIIVQKPGFAGLPDYELFLERCLLLHNDVLKPFMFVLREHLKVIHAFYREIDAWIRAPDAERHLLEQIFSIDFDVNPSSSKHNEIDADKKEESTQASTVARSDTASLLDGDADSCGFSALLEPLGPHDDTISDDENVEVLSQKVDMAHYSKVRRAIADEELVLQQLSAYGRYTLSFQIAESGQKEKLTKFIEFLEN